MGKIRIKNLSEVQRRLDSLLDDLQDGPVFIAKNKRVKAVLMDMTDYYDLLGELEDLAELLHTLGGCGCGCEDDEMNELLDKAFSEAGD
ncbi:type II toxin-antitoxin system Phd/YefM family antitoxin [Dethiobacter alkaliphilus]|uniref:Antitoxin n=1 Tax=Dethiobacter alkaliphilus AHT 1 TaxID=555088 RepID=C0GGU7_DETAL|nr:type II toxin-antitoxin system Phd/YefM family antitoxin [Dethiobacter alkaliphilus]EEG77538.1 prevent-host-death family protein [Dethiobacter alkaliphilus AHT 1]MCW3488840.1 type II toxin-antitoxin system Phd/YefM family antitoxin [Dethiobacter alkaliphilus]